jgi:hypothetical protein
MERKEIIESSPIEEGYVEKILQFLPFTEGEREIVFQRLLWRNYLDFETCSKLGFIGAEHLEGGHLDKNFVFLRELILLGTQEKRHLEYFLGKYYMWRLEEVSQLTDPEFELDFQDFSRYFQLFIDLKLKVPKPRYWDILSHIVPEKDLTLLKEMVE